MAGTVGVDVGVKVKSSAKEIAVLIGELADRAGSTPRALRYYEQRGLLDSCRTGNGYRSYDESAVLRVRQVRALLDAGFGSDSIAVLLPCARGVDARIDLCPSVVAEMQRVLAGVDTELTELQRRRGAISGRLDPLQA